MYCVFRLLYVLAPLYQSIRTILVSVQTKQVCGTSTDDVPLSPGQFSTAYPSSAQATCQQCLGMVQRIAQKPAV